MFALWGRGARRSSGSLGLLWRSGEPGAGGLGAFAGDFDRVAGPDFGAEGFVAGVPGVAFVGQDREGFAEGDDALAGGQAVAGLAGGGVGGDVAVLDVEKLGRVERLVGAEAADDPLDVVGVDQQTAGRV